MKLRVENLYYSYNDKSHALCDISFSVEEGTIYAIMGATGSGKSTLLKLLNGLYTPLKGRIYIDGEDYSFLPPLSLPFRVGLVFQYPETQLFEESVIKDVSFGPINMGKSKEEVEKAAIDALEIVGISKDKWNKPPFALSGGEKRRVALAGVIAMNPEILVLDEIAAGLDQEGKERIFSIIKGLKNKGKTIILVSHSPDDVAAYADRVLVLDKGKVLVEGDVRKVFSSPLVAKPSCEIIAQYLRGQGVSLPFPILTLDELVDEYQKEREK